MTQGFLHWLHLNERIGSPNSSVRIELNQIPKGTQKCTAKVTLADNTQALSDLTKIPSSDLRLSAKQKACLSLLSQSGAFIVKSDLISLNEEQVGQLLHFASDVTIEVADRGIIAPTGTSLRLKASIDTQDSSPSLRFFLENNNGDRVKNYQILGRFHPFVLDEHLRLFNIEPTLIAEEANALLDSQPLAIEDLTDENARQLLDNIAALGIDLSSLSALATEPNETLQIVLRLIPQTNKENGLSLRIHLVTQLTYEGKDHEWEIPAKGALSPIIAITSTSNALLLMKRQLLLEERARQFLFSQGASASLKNKGFRASGPSAYQLLETLVAQHNLPDFIKLEKDALPEVMHINETVGLVLQEAPAGNHDKFMASISVDKALHHLSLQSLIKLLSHKQNSLLTEDDRLLVFSPESLKNIVMLAEVLDIEELDGEKKLSFSEAAMLYLALQEKIRIDANDSLKNRLHQFDMRPLPEDGLLPEGLKTALRSYQHDAVGWLSQLHRIGLGRILADDMGLGKTLMVLTFLTKLKEKHGQKVSLVVAPTSVIDVWVLEAQKHVPSLKVCKWHGSDRKNIEDSAKDCDIIVTTYALLRKDISGSLGQIDFRYLILDEAQNVKNNRTESWKAANQIKSEYRLALTGTPIENRVDDLFNILDLVERGALGSYGSFQKRYATPIAQGNTERAQELRMRVHPLILRRRKSEVERELPPKIENMLHCSMSHEQQMLYKNVLLSVKTELHDAIYQDANNKTRLPMLAAITKLRQVCCDPRLLLGPVADLKDSAKINLLSETLEECLALGRRIIIYSQFVKMHPFIHDAVKKVGVHDALWLHGASKNRQEIVDRFQDPNGPKVIVVSLKAGGTGLTLTAADTVIFYDPWWNPAVEDQAADRAHRIGQSKAVHVIKLICENSIEEQIMAMSAKKRIAASNVLTDDKEGTRALSLQDLQHLLAVEIARSFD